jgi:hypothetical protein
MDESTKFAAQYAGFPTDSLSSSYVATELERLHLKARIAAVHKEMHREWRARELRYWASCWPVALGVVLSFYAPLLRDLAAGYASWAETLLFPLSAVAGLHGLNLTSGTAQALAQFLLFAQFPLDGLLAHKILKHRPTVMSVCGHVACLHSLAVLYIALVSGSFNQYLPS